VREGFKAAILERAAHDPNFHILTGDHGYALFDDFKTEFPNRLHNVGVAEANMVGLAAGMARNGLRPLIYGLSAFIPNRVFEYIKLQIALDNLPVTIVGDGAGLVYSTLGTSHQTLEDLAIIGSLPGIQSVSPASAREMEVAVRWAGNLDGPSYIRMGKSGGIYDGSSSRDVPWPHLVRKAKGSSNPRALVAHGSMVSIALAVANSGKEVLDVWSCPTVSEVPQEFIDELLSRYESIAVIEEHGEHGGLGSRILHKMANSGKSLHLIAAKQSPARRIGSWEWTLDKHGLSQERILERLYASGFFL